MPFSPATLDGQPVFGLITEFLPQAHEAAVQESSFFGQNGKLALWGGLRGWRFHIKGIFAESGVQGVAVAALNLDFAALNSFRGPGLHTLIDTSGNSWPNVLVRHAAVPGPRVMATPFGWCREYTMEMESLSG
jgi:hypothetical protein